MGVFTQGATRYSQNIGMVMPAFEPLTVSLVKGGAVAFSNQNLTVTSSGQPTVGGYSTLGSNTKHVSGKYYVEYSVISSSPGSEGLLFGVNSSVSFPNFVGSDAFSIAIFDDGVVWKNSAQIGTSSTIATGDIGSFAFDVDNLEVWHRVNGGNWNGNSSNNPATNTGGFGFTAATPYVSFCTSVYFVGDAVTVDLTPPFVYSPPAGFGPW